MRKLLSLSIIYLFLLMLLSSCGKAASKNNAQIMQDVQRNFSFVLERNLNVKRIEIEKRDTDIANKTDTIYAKISAENQDINCVINVMLEYRLYNDGWLFESIQEYRRSDWTAKPLRGITKKEASALAEEYSLARYKRYDQINFVDSFEDLGNGYQSFIFDMQNDYNYLTQIDTRELVLEFDENLMEWVHQFYIRNTIEHWDINGIWRYEDYRNDKGRSVADVDISSWIQIEDFDGNELSGEYYTHVYFISSFSSGANVTLEESGPFNISGFGQSNSQPRVFAGKKYGYFTNEYTAFAVDANDGVLFYNPYTGDFEQMEHSNGSAGDNNNESSCIVIGGIVSSLGTKIDDMGLRGAELAIEKINLSGGINGKEMDMILYEGYGDDSFAIEFYETLLQNGNITAIWNGARTLPSIALANQIEMQIWPSNIPMIVSLADYSEFKSVPSNMFFVTKDSASLQAQMDNPNPKMQAFIELYEARYSEKPGISAALSYDAINILAEAISTAGGVDSNAINKALGTLQYDGLF